MSENRLLHLEDFSGGEVIELGLGCLGPEQDPPQVTAPMGLSGHSWLRHCCCSEALHQRPEQGRHDEERRQREREEQQHARAGRVGRHAEEDRTRHRHGEERLRDGHENPPAFGEQRPDAVRLGGGHLHEREALQHADGANRLTVQQDVPIVTLFFPEEIRIEEMAEIVEASGLATADAAGRPWPTPVYYATAGYQKFVWVSRPDARHSRNVEERPDVGIVVFDSRVPINAGQAVYMDARPTSSAWSGPRPGRSNR